jgi:hypothetical protein
MPAQVVLFNFNGTLSGDEPIVERLDADAVREALA